MSSSDATRADSKLPAVDARLVAPESRFEILDGALVHVSPADKAHGALHSKIAALLAAHVVTRFMVAVDMLTRTSRTNDFAPDVSVFPRARDPRTGGRQLEQLAFEVVSTESLSHARRKAVKLVGRGVRRVVAVDVKRGRVLEWSRSRARWIALDTKAHLEDPTLAVPLPIKELVTAAAADDAMARALAAKKNPVIEAIRTEDKRETLAKALLGILTTRGIALKRADRARILGEQNPERLHRWVLRAAICTDIAEVFGKA